jgi:hypothetical protein
MNMPEPGTQVREAVAHGPQVSLQHDWRVVCDDDSWRLVTDGVSRWLPQIQVVAAGAAAQEVVVALEAAGHRVQVLAFPTDRPHALAVVQRVGAGPRLRADQLLRADLSGDLAAEPRPLLPSDLRHLSLAAEAFGVELLWQDDVTSPRLLNKAQRVHARDVGRPLSTVVTRGDEPEDWFAAGRALAQCRLVASDLRLAVQLDPHALGRRRTREEVRAEWDLEGWPQAQFTILVRNDGA